MNESQTLQREEVRGVFVLGIIGTLLVLANFFAYVKITPESSLSVVVFYLVSFWGLYVFLTAIGVSEDFVKPEIAETCRWLAKGYFVLGISMTAVVVPYEFVAYYVIERLGLSSGITLVLNVLIPGVLVFIITAKMYRRSSSPM